MSSESSKEESNTSVESKEEILCSYCDKSFMYRSGLCKHIKNKHPDKFQAQVSSNITCNICSERYVLNLHILIIAHNGHYSYT